MLKDVGMTLLKSRETSAVYITCNANTAVKTLCQSAALKVINRIETMSREHGGFSPDVMCSLFSALVQPILEYGCEIWGVTYHQIIEKVLLKFCKGMLGLPMHRPLLSMVKQIPFLSG